MIYNLLLAAVLVLSFILCVYSYILGVKHGRIVKNGGIPRVPSPIKAVENIAEQAAEKKEQKEAAEELSAIFSADKEAMIKAINADRIQRMGRD